MKRLIKIEEINDRLKKEIVNIFKNQQKDRINRFRYLNGLDIKG